MDALAVTDTRWLFVDANHNSVPGANKFTWFAFFDTSWLFVGANYNPVPGANKFNGGLSKWDVSSVASMQAMFFTAMSFDSDVSKWDISMVTNMAYMFYPSRVRSV